MPEYTYDTEIFSDLHKDAYGFRPKGYHYFYEAEATPDQKQEIWDFTLAVLKSEVRYMEQQEQEAIKDFEANIALNIELGAGDRETAIRWIVDALDLDNRERADASYICFELGLSYNYADQFKEV